MFKRAEASFTFQLQKTALKNFKGPKPLLYQSLGQLQKTALKNFKGPKPLLYQNLGIGVYSEPSVISLTACNCE